MVGDGVGGLLRVVVGRKGGGWLVVAVVVVVPRWWLDTAVLRVELEDVLKLLL